MNVSRYGLSNFVGAIALGTCLLPVSGLAQGVETCQPPQPGEYLLMVVTPTADSQRRAQQALPEGVTSSVCRYLNDVVTRVGGFKTLNRVNAWASYMTDSVGLRSFVARPATATSPATSAPVATVSQPKPAAAAKPSQPQTVAKPSQPQTASSSAPVYNPQALGRGYAVLVDYFNQPELAAQVQQTLEQSVGLASYGQRPYLLATYTDNLAQAEVALQTLSDRGFWVMVVDSRRVTVLRQAVAVPKLGTRP